MTSSSTSESNTDSTRLQSTIDDANTEISARLAKRGTCGSDGLLSVFRELETQSKEYPSSEVYLTTAIIAGESVIATLSLGHGDALNVHLGLADLHVRHSRMKIFAPLSDLERAKAIVSSILQQVKEVSSCIFALQKLSAILEEKYQLQGDAQDLHEAYRVLQHAASLANSPERESLLASATCLHFKDHPDAFESVLDIPIQDLPNTPVKWTRVTHEKFRFIDARRFAAGESLRVIELDALPRQRYVALSYVWRGAHKEGTLPPGMETMTIEGAVGADPISIDVLTTVCKCVASFGCELLWIDGVCIVQNDPEDKAWQIQRMFEIYKHCKQCLVLPGGLSRLVPLDEPTSWMHRAWTLQEAVVPDSCSVLFSWIRGDCVLQTHLPLLVNEIEPGKAAKADMYGLLQMSMKGKARITTLPSISSSSGEETIDITILVMDHERSQASTLLGALDYRGREGLESAIWRASLTRVQSRPADAVFSIMGILGVNLDPLQFDPNDRKSATIALMQALLQKGERAEWLGVAPRMQINHEIPTLPVFPTVSPEGTALIETANGFKAISAAMGNSWWRPIGTPRGSMDDDGALAIRAFILPVRRDASLGALEFRPEGYSTYDDKPLGSDVWYTALEQQGPPYAVKVGYKEPYLNGALGVAIDPRPWLVMLVDKVGVSDDRVTNMGYVEVGQEIVGLPGWTEREVVIVAAVP